MHKSVPRKSEEKDRISEKSAKQITKQITKLPEEIKRLREELNQKTGSYVKKDSPMNPKN